MIISLVQAPLAWENPILNQLYFQKVIRDYSEKTDVFVLPEMFTSGFTMHPSGVAESMEGETIRWLQELAKEKEAAITGSLVIFENKNFYNRMVFVHPNGGVVHYDKRHLFTLAGEDKLYTAGTEKKMVLYKGWKICLQICYDLRFPVFSRNVEDFDLLLYVANWPKVRTNAWDILLRARAVENLCYVIGINRIGLDGNEMEYIGHSQAVDELGNYVLEPQTEEGIYTVQLDYQKMRDTRYQLDFLSGQDVFKLL
jgi:omega-amidase